LLRLPSPPLPPQEGRSFWSPPGLATTAATGPSIPVGLTVMGTSRTSVTLSWQEPASSGGSPVTGYEVQLQAATRAARDVLGDDWLIIYSGPSTATTFSALQPGCSYMARVSARNAAGASPFSIAVQFSTSPDVPVAPAVPDTEVDCTVSGRGRGVRAGGSPWAGTLRRRRACAARLQSALARPRSPMPHAAALCPLLAVPQMLLLKWQPPSHDGGAPVASYRVEMRCSPEHANGDLEHSGVEPQQSLALTPHFLTIYRWGPGRGKG
jgi:hypothetical protein